MGEGGSGAPRQGEDGEGGAEGGVERSRERGEADAASDYELCMGVMSLSHR